MHVLLVADQASSLESLQSIAREALAGAAIHVEKTLGAALAAMRGARHFHLVLLDLDLRGFSGTEALAGFCERYPRCRILVFAAAEERSAILSALKSGAAGYIPKRSGRKVSVAALRLVAEGGKYVPPEILSEAHPVRVPVTSRQRDVLRLLLKGYSNQRIASELTISQSTVKQHAHAVFDALGVSTRAQLLATAARGGIHAD
jgi:DNA-binding NarL/FixJ family response regulator